MTLGGQPPVSALPTSRKRCWQHLAAGNRCLNETIRFKIIKSLDLLDSSVFSCHLFMCEYLALRRRIWFRKVILSNAVSITLQRCHHIALRSTENKWQFAQ